MKDGIQNMFFSFGQSGCYALCLIDVAEEESGKSIDAVKAVSDAIDKGYIRYDWSNWGHPDNFYVEHPALFLEQMTGKKWAVRKDLAGRAAGEREYVIRRYEYKSTGRTTGHFERDSFKPYLNSRTVRFGNEVSVRVCEVLN